MLKVGSTVKVEVTFSFIVDADHTEPEGLRSYIESMIEQATELKRVGLAKAVFISEPAFDYAIVRGLS